MRHDVGEYRLHTDYRYCGLSLVLDHAMGPNVIRNPMADMTAAMDTHGWATLEDFRGIHRDRVVAHSTIRRPDAKAYHGGYDAAGYAAAEALVPGGGTA